MVVELLDVGDRVFLLQARSEPQAVREYAHWQQRTRHIELRPPFSLPRFADACRQLADNLQNDPPQDDMGPWDPRVVSDT